MIVLHKEIHTALDPAVRTMRRHDAIYDPISPPAAIRRIMQMRPEGFDDLFEIFDLAHCSLLSVVPTLDSRPLKYTGILLGQRGVRQAAYDSFAARTVILPNLSITHRVVKAEFVDGGFEIVQPHLGYKLDATARTNGLRHFSCASLVKLDANRCRPLNHVKE